MNCSLKQIFVRFLTKIQDWIKNPDHYDFSSRKRNDVSKKGLFFIHFHRNDPRYLRYHNTATDNVASLLISRCILDDLMFKDTALDGPNEDATLARRYVLEK